MEAAVRTSGLRKEFHGAVAVRDLDLVVPTGSVFGYLGPNGAGKTTTIRLLAGLLRPTRGRAEVLGMDVARHRDEVQRRIGYLPGRFVAYPDLTGAEYLQFLGSLRGGVTWPGVARLAERFELDLTRRIGQLSHGSRQKVGIVQAFMHQPELLVLDEPTAGLDPIMQQEFLGLVNEVSREGRTVFLSSHILSEVEAAADSVAILREGTLVTTSTIPELRGQVVRHWDVTFVDEVPLDVLRGCGHVGPSIRVHGRTAHLVLEGSSEELLRAIAPYGVENIQTHEADLTEVFLQYYTRDEEPWPVPSR